MYSIGDNGYTVGKNPSDKFYDSKRKIQEKSDTDIAVRIVTVVMAVTTVIMAVTTVTMAVTMNMIFALIEIVLSFM